MELQEKLTALRGIANTPANMLTSEDKKFVSDIATEHGVTIRSKRCNSCYIDAAVEVFGLLSKQNAGEAETDKNCQYVLKQGVDILFNGIRVNEATITDEKQRRSSVKVSVLSFRQTADRMRIDLNTKYLANVDKYLSAEDKDAIKNAVERVFGGLRALR